MLRARNWRCWQHRESPNGISLSGRSHFATSIAPIYGGFGTKGGGAERREGARGEKTHTFRINIVPRSRKEKGRSTERIAPGFGEELPLHVGRGRRGFHGLRGCTLAPLERSSTVVPPSRLLLRLPLSRKSRHLNTTRAAVSDNTYPLLRVL